MQFLFLPVSHEPRTGDALDSEQNPAPAVSAQVGSAASLVQSDNTSSVTPMPEGQAPAVTQGIDASFSAELAPFRTVYKGTHAQLDVRTSTEGKQTVVTVLEGSTLREAFVELGDLQLPSLAGQSIASIEKRAILETLAHFRGNKPLAAKSLGISLKTLYTKLEKYASDAQFSRLRT